MQILPQSDATTHAAEQVPTAARVREQLRLLLAHSLFTNSKRYPVLLAYVVEQSLAGNAGDLKERTVGMEAFGREPAYDVNLDPVVRMTAAEVRKRLIQYYYAPEHAGQLVIELPLGTYAPTFREPGNARTQVAAEAAAAVDSDTAAALSVAAASVPAPRRFPVRIVTLVLVAVALGFAAGRIRLPRPSSTPPLSNMERFWLPITATTGRVTYCLGQPTDPLDRDRAAAGVLWPSGSLNVSDVITLARSIAPIVPRDGAFRVVAAPTTEFTQLREGPNVLIGAFDNQWTLRLTEELPFGFQLDNDLRKIVDRRTSQGHFWTLQWQTPGTKLSADYAIIARIHDTTTGQPMIIIGGILAEGTEAAGELISSPALLDAMLAQAPGNWDQLNLEAVIETRVIDSHPGPPHIVALRTW